MVRIKPLFRKVFSFWGWGNISNKLEPLIIMNGLDEVERIVIVVMGSSSCFFISTWFYYVNQVGNYKNQNWYLKSQIIKFLCRYFHQSFHNW